MSLTRRIAVAGIAMLLGFTAAWLMFPIHSAQKVERIVAMSWGDGKYGPAFYGAEVYLEPLSSGYAVYALVHIGRNNGMFHDCGKLGEVQTDAEAVARWGRIEWREDGLHIGSSPDSYFLPRATLESHR